MLDVISIGDSTVDVFLQIDHATLMCDLRHDECKLCFNYSDKIPISAVHKIPGGGNAANHAFGEAKLGLKVAIYTIVGNDENGSEIINCLKKGRVDCRHIFVDKTKNSNYSTILNYKGQRTILSFHEKRNYIWPKLKPAKWLFFSSISSDHEKIHEHILKYLKRTGARLVFSPGTHQLNLGLKKLKEILESASVIFLNKEEAWHLLGKKKTIQNTLTSVCKLGPQMVVITDGKKGSYCYDGVHIYQQKILAGPVVEVTGAGDAYASAFLGALICGHTVIDAMRWGTVNSAHVLRYIGAHEGLQSKKQIQDELIKHPELRPVVLV